MEAMESRNLEAPASERSWIERHKDNPSFQSMFLQAGDFHALRLNLSLGCLI